MDIITTIKSLFRTPIEPDYQAEVALALTKEFHKTELFMGLVILVFQAVMMISSYLRGGLFTYIRKDLYFYLYALLFFITACFLVLTVYLYKHHVNRVRLHENATLVYFYFLCFWSCGITMLDQHSGTGVTVFSYILMAVAVFNILRPWKSLLLFSSSFICLNVLAITQQNNEIFFKVEPSIYSILMNSFFVTALAIITAIMLYRYRVLHHYNQIKIHEQYDEIYKMNEKLNHLAMTDQLTQLGNRRYLEQQILELIDENKKTPHLVSGIMIDIDFFKQYNDLYGHQSGDYCLQTIAQLISSFAKEHDGFAVRYGGEEFFICMQDIDQILQIAERLRKDIENQNINHDASTTGKVTVSMGISETQNICQLQQDEFLRQCDEALYRAKNRGRNRIAQY